MAGPFTRQTVENWAADFVTGRAAAEFEPVVREFAPEFLVPLLLAPCEEHGCEPGDLGEEELRSAFTGAVARVELPESVRERVPDVCALFLEELEREGRLAGGRVAGLALRAARRAYLDAVGAPREPVRRAAPKLSPNDPCPCGSGRKYKKCCR
jgi:hypothetical protein